jgi:acetolactate synthase-1/2/3 large subunit
VSEGSAESLDGESNDGLDMVKPFVKWAKSVTDVNRIEEYLSAALHQASSGRPGVAVLGIPTHLEGERLRPGKRLALQKLKPTRPQPDSHVIQALAQAIRSAQRPLILCGSGAALSGAGPALRDLTYRFGIPVFAHALGRGLVPEDLDHGYPWALAQVAAKRADLVIAVGLRLQQRIGYGLAPRFAENALFAQIDIESTELGRTRKVDFPLHCDAQAGAQALVDALAATAQPEFSRQCVSRAAGARRRVGPRNEWPNSPLRDCPCPDGKATVERDLRRRRCGHLQLDVRTDAHAL